LVEEGVLPLNEAIARLTIGPARALGLPGGTLEVGRPADITVINPGLKWELDPARLYSRGRNTPFGGWKMKGAAIRTLVDGRMVYRREE